MIKKILAFIVILTLVAFIGAKKPVILYMAGDSTMTVNPLTKPVTDSITGKVTSEPFPYRGWGQMLPAFFNSNVIIKNYAQSGRSSKTFLTQGWWKKIMDSVQADHFVVIGFGHNDESYKTDRKTTPEEFELNMRKYVKDVRGKNAVPILCTPVVRRKFKDGKLEDTHGVYADIVRKIASDEKVLLIDMQRKSAEVLLQYGESESKKLFVYLSPNENRNYPKGVEDDTHFNELGANTMAGLFIDGIQELKVKPLTKHLNK